MRKMLSTMVLLLAVTMVQGGAVLAADSAYGLPDSYEGVIDDVNVNEHYILIGDRPYQLADYTVVRNVQGGVVAKSSLKVGEEIRFVATTTDASEPEMVTEIWIISR
jgi:hypothetical protein